MINCINVDILLGFGLVDIGTGGIKSINPEASDKPVKYLRFSRLCVPQVIASDSKGIPVLPGSIRIAFVNKESVNVLREALAEIDLLFDGQEANPSEVKK